MMISIIIPVYNAEQYIGRCIESILQQTFSDYELILIDDVSKDGSRRVCEEYAQKDYRIRYYKNEHNLGVAGARNVGLDNAQGDYIMFCDDDDIVSPHWIEHMLRYMKQDASILPICSIAQHQGQLGDRKHIKQMEAEIYNKVRYYQFNKIGIAGYIWNTIYRSDIIREHRIRFRSFRAMGDINEDLIFSLDYVQWIDKVAYVGFSDYYHAKNETNLSTVTDDRFYFEKYQEKYRLWKYFITRQAYEQQSDDICHLSTNTLYHFVKSLLYSVRCIGHIRSELHYFKKVINAPELKDALCYADLSNEGHYIVYMLQHKQYFRLWIFFKIASLLKN